MTVNDVFEQVPTEVADDGSSLVRELAPYDAPIPPVTADAYETAPSESATPTSAISFAAPAPAAEETSGLPDGLHRTTDFLTHEVTNQAPPIGHMP